MVKKSYVQINYTQIIWRLWSGYKNRIHHSITFVLVSMSQKDYQTVLKSKHHLETYKYLTL